MSSEPARLEREIDRIRGNLTGVLGELDLRRHELLDWRLQLRRHRGAIVGSAGALLAVGAATLVVTALVRRRRASPPLRVRAARMRQALSRAVADPDAVARPSPGLAQKLLIAVISAAASVAARKVAGRMLQGVHEG